MPYAVQLKPLLNTLIWKVYADKNGGFFNFFSFSLFSIYRYPGPKVLADFGYLYTDGDGKEVNRKPHKNVQTRIGRTFEK